VSRADADLEDALGHVRAEEDAHRNHPGRGRRRTLRAAGASPGAVPAGLARSPGRHAVTEPIDLAYLCHHYGEAYEINMRRRRYEACRRDDGTMLTADSADAPARPDPRRLRRPAGLARPAWQLGAGRHPHTPRDV
jgi:hypothetical protein